MATPPTPPAPPSNQTAGTERHSCPYAQARIAAFFAKQLRPAEDARPILALRISELEIAACRVLALLDANPCGCHECRRPMMTSDHVNPHGAKPQQQKGE